VVARSEGSALCQKRLAHPHTNRLVNSKQALRQQAEEIIIERAVQPLVDSGMLSYEEMQRKLQELHVHQIELEIQNKELLLLKMSWKWHFFLL